MKHRLEEIKDGVGVRIRTAMHAQSEPGGSKPRTIGVADESLAIADQYDLLAGQVVTSATKTRFRKVMVASAKHGEGRTTVLLNLAAALQRMGEQVMVVDCDFVGPSVGRMLEMKTELSLRDVVERGLPDNIEVLRRTTMGFSALPLREKILTPAHLLTSAGFTELVSALAARFDYVLFDSSPMRGPAHWHLVAQVVDKMLLVIQPGAARVDELAQALRPYAQSDIVGVVLNQVKA